MDVSTIAERAAGYRPVKAVLTVLAVPFWLAGLLAALVWLAVTWCVAASVQGFDDMRARVASTSDVGD